MPPKSLCYIAHGGPSQWQAYRGVDARAGTMAPMVAGPMYLRAARAGSGNPFE